jgi:hypothetical protein
VLTAFFFPILLHTIGTVMLLYVLVCTSILGAAVTWIFAIETRGLNLESLGAGTTVQIHAKESSNPLPNSNQEAA